MPKTKLILTEVIFFVFSLSLVGIYVYAQTIRSVWHPASEITQGNFQVGTYNFPSSSMVGIGTTSPAYKLDVSGAARLGRGTNISLVSNGGGQLIFANNPNDNNIYIEAFSRDGSRSANNLFLTGRNAGNVPVIGLYANGTYVTGSMNAPIYYDSQNSGYYVDPAGTSVLNSICAGGNCSDYLTHDSSGYLRNEGDFRVTKNLYNDLVLFTPQIRPPFAVGRDILVRDAWGNDSARLHVYHIWGSTAVFEGYYHGSGRAVKIGDAMPG